MLKRLLQAFGDDQLRQKVVRVKASRQDPGIFLAEMVWGASWRRLPVVWGCWQDFLGKYGTENVPALPCGEEELRSAVEEHGLFPVYIPPALARQVGEGEDGSIFAKLAELFSFHESVTHRLIQRENGGESSHLIKSWNDDSLYQNGWLWVEADLKFPEDKTRSHEHPVMYPDRVYPYGATAPMSVLTFVVFFQFLRYILGDSFLDGSGYSEIYQTVFPKIIAERRSSYGCSDKITLSWQRKMLYHEQWYSRPEHAQYDGMRSVIPMTATSA